MKRFRGRAGVVSLHNVLLSPLMSGLRRDGEADAVTRFRGRTGFVSLHSVLLSPLMSRFPVCDALWGRGRICLPS